MARLYLKRTLSGFEPADEPSRDAWKRFAVGERYRADIVKPRNYEHHKMILALLHLTFDNQDRYDNFENFRKAVAADAGHCEELIAPSGEVFKVPKSISYDELDEEQFTKVAGAMMTVCAKLLHGMGLADLEAEVARYADEHYG